MAWPSAPDPGTAFSKSGTEKVRKKIGERAKDQDSGFRIARAPAADKNRVEYRVSSSVLSTIV
jgi:hypothetical protein